jgi:hypothetical protein
MSIVLALLLCILILENSLKQLGCIALLYFGVYEYFLWYFNSEGSAI